VGAGASVAALASPPRVSRTLIALSRPNSSDPAGERPRSLRSEARGARRAGSAGLVKKVLEREERSAERSRRRVSGAGSAPAWRAAQVQRRAVSELVGSFQSRWVRLSAMGAVTHSVATSAARARLLVSPALARRYRGTRPTGRPWLERGGRTKEGQASEQTLSEAGGQRMCCPTAVVELLGLL
jgi:hypothetical protein